MMNFQHYAAAKKEGDKIVADLAKGKAIALSPGQIADALNAAEELQRYYQATGQRVSIRFAVGAYCENMRKLNGRPLSEAVDGFLSNVASVKRVDLKTAVEKFIESRQLKTVAKDGKRPQLSPGWHYIISKWLNEFANSFPGHTVTDLTQEHLTKYLNGHSGVSARTRNGRRNAVKMFLNWAVERDYIAANHRLFVADGMAKETEDFGDIEFYTPKELRLLLDGAKASEEYKCLLPVIALGAFAGLRLQEIVRLTWSDVWRVRGHIEIAATKSKTRQRRLVQIVPALSQWLQDHRKSEGNVWQGTLDSFHDLFGTLRDELKVPVKRNALRHAFCTYHYSLHANENLTAQQAGNSPGMIHGHYKGLATKKEARQWFAVRPAKAANVIHLKKGATGPK